MSKDGKACFVSVKKTITANQEPHAMKLTFFA